jgi:hypothetical protein
MYVGEYVIGKRCGSGIYYFPNGERYEGRFIDDKPTNNGTYIMNEEEERDELNVTYIFSDGRKEIIKILNEEEN